MTQDYLNHIFENYTGVEKFYWTADGTAFTSIEKARNYSKILGDPAIKEISHGGKIEDAVDAEAPGASVGHTEGGYRDETNAGENGGGEDGGGENGGENKTPAEIYESLSVPALKGLCASREIALNGATKKADIIALLLAADVAANQTEE
jgi:hypothetical protein